MASKLRYGGHRWVHHLMMAPPKKLSYRRASGLKNLGAVNQKTFSTASVKLRRTQCEQMSSELPLKADIAQYGRHFAFVPKTEVAESAKESTMRITNKHLTCPNIAHHQDLGLSGRLNSSSRKTNDW
jgi:hypothetical protein